MDRKRQHCRAVTSFPFMVKGKAWLRIKDPPAGEGQVGQNSTAGRLYPLPFWKGRGLGSGLRTLPQGRNRWGKNTSLAKEKQAGSKKNTKGFSFIYRALDIMIIDISKNPQDLQLQLLEKELFSTHHNDDHS